MLKCDYNNNFYYFEYMHVYFYTVFEIKLLNKIIYIIKYYIYML